MIFQKGYLHSDPHPGNILVHKKDNGQVEIVILDHGLYLVSMGKGRSTHLFPPSKYEEISDGFQTIEDTFRRQYSQLWLALLNPNQDEIKVLIGIYLSILPFFSLHLYILTYRELRTIWE